MLSGLLGSLTSVVLRAAGGMMGSAAPLKVSPSLGPLAPTLTGCCWMVLRHAARFLERNEGNISAGLMAPIRPSTSGSLGCTGVLVIVCQNWVRVGSRLAIAAHGAAALYVPVPTVMLVP